MVICIFPGTFNPIHNAHLKMAEFALDNYGFEKVIFIPSYIPPHKNIDKRLAFHRLNMVKLVVSANPKFDVSDIEYLSEGKSYSIITVKKLIEQYSLIPPLNFIIGSDAFVKTESWFKPDELKKLVHFIVFPRRCGGDENVYNDMRKKGWDFELAPLSFIDISSTEIRQTLKQGDTNQKVEDYIINHELYKKS